MVTQQLAAKFVDVCRNCGYKETLDDIEKRRRVNERANGRTVPCPRNCGGKLETSEESRNFLGI